MRRLSNQFVAKLDYPGEKKENRWDDLSCYSTIDADKYSMHLHPLYLIPEHLLKKITTKSIQARCRIEG